MAHRYAAHILSLANVRWIELGVIAFGNVTTFCFLQPLQAVATFFELSVRISDSLSGCDHDGGGGRVSVSKTSLRFRLSEEDIVNAVFIHFRLSLSNKKARNKSKR